MSKGMLNIGNQLAPPTNGNGKRKGMFERLFSSQKKGYMDLLFESIAAPVVVVDTNLTITLVNDAALGVMGYGREEVVGKKSWPNTEA